MVQNKDKKNLKDNFRNLTFKTLKMGNKEITNSKEKYLESIHKNVNTTRTQKLT